MLLINSTNNREGVYMLQNKIKHTCTILVTIIFLLVPLTVNAEMPISIDGYFDDWADKPHTAFYYDIYNSAEIKKVALFSDDKFLYGHIKMSQLQGSFDSYTMNLSINNSYYLQLVVMCTDDNYVIDWGKSFKYTPPGTHFDVAVYNNQDFSAFLGKAALVIYSSDHIPADDVEFSINYDKLRKYCNNIPVSEIKTITLTCSSLGSQSITLSGTSTEPFIGIIVTLLLIGIVLLYRNYRHSGKSL